MAIGKFVWFDLATSDTASARKFYSKAFGWDIDESPGYHHMKNGGVHIGGMRQLGKDEPAPPHWLGYVEVADVEATLTAVKRSGGEVVVPAQSIDSGRFAVFRDPQGAHAAIYQHGKAGGADPDPMQPGNFCWSELQTTDPDAAARFYGAVFGWTAKKWPGPFDYWTLERDGKSVAGLMKLPEGVPMPHWLHAVGVRELDTKVASAKELGAHVLHGPSEIPNVGRFAVMADPTGAVLNFFEGTRH